MLTHLTIKNYALIEHLEMDLSAHLNVITGETGAGKSIMLGALGLLLGNRADTKVLWNEKEKCITEGIFDIHTYHLESFFESENLDYEKQTVIRREISPAGKSRAFINDTPVTLDVMRKVGVKLMDIHSQHETLDIGNRAFQMLVIDAYAANDQVKNDYKKAWQGFTNAKQAHDALREEANNLRQEADFVNFQLKELVLARLEENEQEQLESALKIMEHAEEIKAKFNQLLALLDQSEISANSILSEARSVIFSISSYSEKYKILSERFENIRLELSDIIEEARQAEEAIEFDAEKIEETKERLSLIYQLQQKHRVGTIAELITLQNEFQLKANKTNTLDEELILLSNKLELAKRELTDTGEKLSQSRKASFKNFSKQIEELLSSLGIPEANLKIEHHLSVPGPTGIDSIEFLFSANKGIPVRPLGQVASGGEFSRVMFCIKFLLAEKTALPTLILDEIDTGVSGEIAIRLGRMMKVMAKNHQILAISHLPQIAAKADVHFYAYKDSNAKKTISNIKPLTEEERINEIAKMIGGEKPSSLAKENAKELITG